MNTKFSGFICLMSCMVVLACKVKSDAPSAEAINAIDLKRGDIVMCGTEGKNFGDVVFEISCSKLVR
ncbi:MAG: hypothetical protein ABIQ11_09840, partial [Saprospiraceae bacterium]